MTKLKRKKLYKLLEEWVRYDIAARFAPIGWIGWGDCFREKLKREEEIRKLMFGVGTLLELGELWKIKGCYEDEKIKKKKKNKGSLKDVKLKKKKGKSQIKH